MLIGKIIISLMIIPSKNLPVRAIAILSIPGNRGTSKIQNTFLVIKLTVFGPRTTSRPYCISSMVGIN